MSFHDHLVGFNLASHFLTTKVDAQSSVLLLRQNGVFFLNTFYSNAYGD
jgi:hypothetical protein